MKQKDKDRIVKLIHRIGKLKCFNKECPKYERCHGVDRKRKLGVWNDKLILYEDVWNITEDIKHIVYGIKPVEMWKKRK